MIHDTTHADYEQRELLREAATTTITPGYRIALEGAVAALERLREVAK